MRISFIYIYVDIDERDNLEEKMGLCNQYLACAGYSIQVEHDDTYCTWDYFLSVQHARTWKKTAFLPFFFASGPSSVFFLIRQLKAGDRGPGGWFLLYMCCFGAEKVKIIDLRYVKTIRWVLFACMKSPSKWSAISWSRNRLKSHSYKKRYNPCCFRFPGLWDEIKPLSHWTEHRTVNRRDTHDWRRCQVA